LNLASGVSIDPGTVNATARTVLCNEGLRTPLVTKKQLSSNAFTSLASTVEGDGEIFYAPMPHAVNTADQKEFLFIIKLHNERELPFSIPELPKYRYELDRTTIHCVDRKFANLKSD
jgi:hypothetical protein